MRHRLLFLIAALTLGMPLSAQQEPPDAAPPATEAPPAETPPADAAPDESAGDEAENAGAAEARRASAEEENDFVPTQEVPPDEEAVFPVDF